MNTIQSLLSRVGLFHTKPPIMPVPAAEESPTPSLVHETVRESPVRLCEVHCFDNSLSMAEGVSGVSRRDVLKEAFRHRVQRLQGEPEESVLLGTLRFSTVYYQNLWWTTKLADADDSMFAHEFATDGTSFIAAMEGALFFLQHLEAPQAFRRVVLFTDGHHMMPGDPVAAAELVKGTGAQLVCVGCAPDERDVDMAMLRRMASLDDCGRPCVEFAGTPGDLVRFMGDLDCGIERWPS